jgi:predicted nucleotidyltransferase
MRLTQKEIEAIKQVFLEVFEDGKIYLFGSRLDDSKRGGDIDLFIETSHQDKILNKKIHFLTLLKQKIGDQKIDVIISKDITRVIEQEALNKGVEL